MWQTPDAGAAEPLTAVQSCALIEELASATKLYEVGLAELHGRSSGGDFFHLPMQLLGQALERLLKLTLALAELEHAGRLPQRQTLRGHDLVALTDRLASVANDCASYRGSEPGRTDLQFMRSHPDLRRVLTILSEFGRRGRYYRLDALLDPDSVDQDADPYRRWDHLEGDFARREPDWLGRAGDLRALMALEQAGLTRLAAVLDRFARALARMWVFGVLPDLARRQTCQLLHLLRLRDENLGVRRSLEPRYAPAA